MKTKINVRRLIFNSDSFDVTFEFSFGNYREAIGMSKREKDLKLSTFRIMYREFSRMAKEKYAKYVAQGEANHGLSKS